MRFNSKRFAAAVLPRHLFLVPNRRTPRARHVPAGRTLHLVDIENLVGESVADFHAIDIVSAEYRRAAALARGDHVIVGAGQRLAVTAGWAWPGAYLTVGWGVDGADKALLAEVANREWVASHFDRVVLGSGDNIFAEALKSFRALGISTGIVASADSISWALQRQADFVRTIDRTRDAQGAA